MAKKKQKKTSAERSGAKNARPAKTASTKPASKRTAKKAPKKAAKPAPAAPANGSNEAKASPAKPKRAASKPPRYATAESMARSQRSISVSEFFAKNRHLLGFDNPRKALLTTVKEAVDNALDACEEAGINPAVEIAIEQLGETHYRVTVTDNGPGIVKKQIPNIFGQLLYGSKFHRLRMSRGQQGIGISAAGMYGLLTTGQPVRIISRTGPRSQAHSYDIQIDTRKNKPDIVRDETVDWDVPHGTSVSIELEARYLRGKQSVDDYLQQTAIANPHVTLTYRAPDGRVEAYPAASSDLPPVPREIRPHPYGVELGVLIKMLQDTKAKTLQQFLTGEFSRVSPRVAGQIIDSAGLTPRTRPKRVSGDAAKKVYAAIQEIKILAPSTDCIVPIGEDQLIQGLQSVVRAAFYTATTRRPAVYRGNPFVIEAALAFGRPEKPDEPDPRGDPPDSPPAAPSPPTRRPAADDEDDDARAARETPGAGDDNAGDDQLAKIIRFANRVPLQYQQGACAITRSVAGINWKQYGLSQGRGALPSGPLTLAVHMGSVWVPFTSESKEALASYPEIVKEIRLAVQDCARRLARHIRKAVRLRQELKKRSYIQKYLPAIGEALQEILDLEDAETERLCANLKDVLERSRKM